jgi:exonuclease VII small subunit
VEGIFFFVFGLGIGMAAMPHLQRMLARARQRLAELDQPRDPDRRP